MKTLSAINMRRKLGSILDEICRDELPVVITRANKPLVVIVPYDRYQEITEKIEKGEKLRRVFCEVREWSMKYEKTLKGKSAVELIREVRQGR